MSTHFHQNTPKSNYFNFPLSAFCCPCAHCKHGPAAHGTLTPGYNPGLALRTKAVCKNGKFGVGSHDTHLQMRPCPIFKQMLCFGPHSLTNKSRFLGKDKFVKEIVLLPIFTMQNTLALW